MSESRKIFEDLEFKLIILGDSGVGKSCIMHHFIYNKFEKNKTQTIGVDFTAKTIKIKEQSIKLQIWDTAGQEKFRAIARNYYRGAIGIILVYDITKLETFNHINTWLNDAKNYTRSECSVIIVGNKTDLDNLRQIKYSEGQKFSEENNLLYIESSANTGNNIGQIFYNISEDILNKIQNGIIDSNSVVSSYAREMKKVQIEENDNNNKNENQSYCQYC
jgi:small GTP-binding protein